MSRVTLMQTCMGCWSVVCAAPNTQTRHNLFMNWVIYPWIGSNSRGWLPVSLIPGCGSAKTGTRSSDRTSLSFIKYEETEGRHLLSSDLSSVVTSDEQQVPRYGIQRGKRWPSAQVGWLLLWSELTSGPVSAWIGDRMSVRLRCLSPLTGRVVRLARWLAYWVSALW